MRNHSNRQDAKSAKQDSSFRISCFLPFRALIPTMLLRLISILLCLLVVSCIDCKEELWINADGSGAAEATYDLPTSAVNLGGGEAQIRSSIATLLEENPSLHSEILSITPTGPRTQIHLRLTFESAVKLIGLSKPESTQSIPASAQQLAGTFDFHLKGREFALCRTIEANKAFAGGLFMPRKEIEGRKLLYILHLPQPPIESNATRTENNGSTLIWDYPLEEALKKPLTTRVRAQIPIPWWAYAAAAGILLGILTLLIRWKPWQRFTSSP